MAKNAQKTNALGLNLNPDSFNELLKKEEQETKQEPPKKEKETVVKKEVEKSVEPDNATAQVPVDILANLKVDKPVGKNYTFYLSENNVVKLKKLAQKQGVSTSKLLDHILSEILV